MSQRSPRPRAVVGSGGKCARRSIRKREGCTERHIEKGGGCVDDGLNVDGRDSEMRGKHGFGETDKRLQLVARGATQRLSHGAVVSS